MNEQILLKDLEDIYNLEFYIKWRDFRLYDIFFKLKIGREKIELSVPILLDMNYTYKQMLENIIAKIDKEILDFVRRK